MGDEDDKPVDDLTADDFILTEDGVPQTISVFEFEKLDDSAPPPLFPPLAEAPGPAPPADQTRIAPVPPGDDRYQDRRLLALYFDMGSMSDADRFRALGAAQKACADIKERFGDQLCRPVIN